jgi:hypothetical protein
MFLDFRSFHLSRPARSFSFSNSYPVDVIYPFCQLAASAILCAFPINPLPAVLEFKFLDFLGFLEAQMIFDLQKVIKDHRQDGA